MTDSPYSPNRKVAARALARHLVTVTLAAQEARTKYGSESDEYQLARVVMTEAFASAGSQFQPGGLLLASLAGLAGRLVWYLLDPDDPGVPAEAWAEFAAFDTEHEPGVPPRIDP